MCFGTVIIQDFGVASFGGVAIVGLLEWFRTLGSVLLVG